MAVQTTLDGSPGSPAGPNSPASPAKPPRRWGRIAMWVALGLVALVVVAVAVLFFGRDRAEQLTEDDALAGFRDTAAEAVETEGLPAPGVYAATASGNESIGLPGFDEELGPNAPVTVTHDGDCFVYRADFNSHHWRAWTFCPTDSTTFALEGLESWTARKAPALDIETLSTYVCDTPLGFMWDGMAEGDTRSGSCTGTSDADDSVTDDAGEVEVLATGETTTIDGQDVETLQIRLTDNLSGDQTGSEVGTWTLDATTGLPLRISTEASLTGGLSDYSEQIDLELGTLTPAT
ncbi:MAG: hypothetical protein M9922_08245 [Microthrixaceae bacterium]|nr:hypothetical protein [Microthrixaceae bacterium]